MDDVQRSGGIVDAEYEIHVRGRIDANARLELAPVQEVPIAASTVLVCRAADAAEVHGLITRIGALGLELIEVRRLPPSQGPVGAGDASARSSPSPRPTPTAQPKDPCAGQASRREPQVRAADVSDRVFREVPAAGRFDQQRSGTALVRK